MTLQQYQQDSKRTLPDLGSYQLNICHMIFGINGEVNEMLEAKDYENLGEEFSDTFWYLSNYCNFTNINLSDFQIYIPDRKEQTFFKDKTKIIELTKYISTLTDLEKKELAYKKKVMPEQRYKVVQEVFYALIKCYNYYEIDMFESLQKNIDKLKARYPEKFTEELANNRNLELERKILEGK